MRPIPFLLRSLAAAAVLAAFVVPARADSDALDAGLRDAAPKLIQYLQAKNCENVGVLKFLVDRGDGKPVDNAGPLNAGIAGRLEVALLLALRDEKPGVIAQASETAAKVRGGSHLTLEGRKKLFGRQYVLAWGAPDRPVTADRFLTGVVAIAKDLRQTTVRIDAFGPDGELEQGVATVNVETPPRVLVETGHNYLMTPTTHPDLFSGARGAIKKSELQKTVVDQTIQYETKNVNAVPLPSFEKDGPVRLTVLVNGREAPIENGAIPEPEAGDKLAFRLENTSDAVHGVVLKVNGENTIFREKFDAKDCYKWILKPGEKVTVAGFQETPALLAKFDVLSSEESQANEVNYGPLAGTFQLTAFRGKLLPPGTKPKPPAAEDPEAVLASAAISRGSVTFADGDNARQARPQTLAALQEQLKGREKDPTDGRGMVGSGAQAESKVEKVTFEASPPEAVMNYTIRYYKPKAK